MAVLDDLGVGAALVREELRPLPGAAVAIFGLTDVGLGAVIAAKDLGCKPIFVVDESSARLYAAVELGATHVVDPGWDDPVAAIHSVRSRGVRFIVDTTDGGAPVAECLAPTGICVTPQDALALAA